MTGNDSLRMGATVKTRWSLGRILAMTLAFCIFAPIAQVLVYKLVPPPITILMVQRLIEGKGIRRT